MPRRRLLLASLVLPLATLVSGCGGDTSTGVVTAQPSPSVALTYAASVVGADGEAVQVTPGSGRLGPGFVTPSAPPPPGGTMTPSPTSWDGVHVPAGFTAVLLSTDDTPAARHLTTAVTRWAADNDVTLTRVRAHRQAGYVGAIQRAIDLHPDLVISAGDPLADPMALVTSAWLDQDFLLLGSELAEPTYNVTAATWEGTSARGGAGAGVPPDLSTFTVERAGRALDAGVAAVLRGWSGYVVEVS